jgi:L-threonylcarbamoyladenylate synthase
VRHARGEPAGGKRPRRRRRGGDLKARARRADEPGAVDEAARLLREGGLVAFPTETVYGLGANALDVRAVARVFEAKARPSFDPLIVHVSSAAALPRVAVPEPRAEELAARFWPGPLSLVLPRQPAVPDLVTAGLDSVAVRVPDHPAALALLRAADRPVAAPSANPFGYVSPTTVDHVLDQLGDRVDLVLDGGPCRVGVESTILALLTDTPTLLRPGGVTKEQLEDALGREIAVTPPTDKPIAPGQLSRHYATRTPLRILDGPAGPAPAARVGLLAQQGSRDDLGYAAVEILAPDGQVTTAAQNLFAALRRLDALSLDLLLAEPCREEGLGRAIMDRLRRCAARA